MVGCLHALWRVNAEQPEASRQRARREVAQDQSDCTGFGPLRAVQGTFRKTP